MRSRLAAILLVVLGFGAVVALGWLAYQLGPTWELGIGVGAFIVTLLTIAAQRRTPLSMGQVALVAVSIFSLALTAGLLDMAGLWWASAVAALTLMAVWTIFPPWGTHARQMQNVLSTLEPEETEPAGLEEPDDAQEPQVWRSAAHQREWDAVEHHQGIVVYPDKWKLLGIGIYDLALSAG